MLYLTEFLSFPEARLIIYTQHALHRLMREENGECPYLESYFDGEVLNEVGWSLENAVCIPYLPPS